MNGNPLFPFERNRYYSGKMLTSADFITEQRYVNNKRRFLNNYMYGSGIVCGCNVYNIDEMTVFVESGLALDSLGREIVVNTSVVKKLSVIKGFGETESNQITLCLKYKEEKIQPSCLENQDDSQCEYNRIKEGYELFVKDTDPEENSEVMTSFLMEELIYQDDNYEIYLVMPKTVSKNRTAKIQFKVKKLSAEDVSLFLQGSLQMPSFLIEDGKNDLEVNLSSLNLGEGKSKLWDYTVFVQDTPATITNIILKNIKVKTLGKDKELEKEIPVKIYLSDANPREIINYELGKYSIEKNKKEKDYICLANISLLRTEGTYRIQKVEEKEIKKYIETPSKNEQRSIYLEFFSKNEKCRESLKDIVRKEGGITNTLLPESKVQIATGVLEIPIGGKAKAGEVFYSGEIMHGLGAGTVYVEIGQEFLEEDGIKGANTKSTVYGNSKLFSKMGNLIPKTEKAVKVLNDKGSFIAAISFTEETDCLMMSYRWVAVKVAGNDSFEMTENTDKKRIEAKTPTVVLGTGESYYFGVKFHEMDKCSITYQVTDANGGKITMDGIYTAPNKEGVYEIMISCIEYPYICTYAYAIVRKK